MGVIALFAAAQLLFFPLGDFPLQSGQKLEKTQIGYRTWGEMNAAKDNVILVPSWFNGKSGDMEAYIGPGNLIDPAGYYVVVVDALSNGVSTSPSNSETQRGEKYPKIAIADMVETQYRLMRHLGVAHVHAVIGISMGGMQAFQWAVQYPEFMTQVVPIVGTPKMGMKDMLLWTTYINMIPGANGKKKTLADLLRFGRANSSRAKEEAQFASLFEGMNNAADTRQNNIALPKSPNDVRRQFEAILAHNVVKKGATLEQTARNLKAKLFVVSATQDKVVSPELPLEFADFAKARKMVLEGECGHNAYKCEKDKLGPELNRFFRGQ